jgi:hypothetical protein
MRLRRAGQTEDLKFLPDGAVCTIEFPIGRR